MKRRDFLKSVMVVAGAGAASGLLDACGGSTNYKSDANLFPQSVASGDPTTNSVVLWVRVQDPAANGADITLSLQVATDAGFGNLVFNGGSLVATAAHDGSLKVKVIGLSAASNYYYRFLYTRQDGTYASRTGRTRTAHNPTDDVPVRFAVLNCQDYIGRYWNSMSQIPQAGIDFDFLIGIGDYIYETTGDSTFQTPTANRDIAFRDQAGVENVGHGAAAFQAASSLDNYRQLYQIYRTDPALQALHEQYPFIMTWDDHEYSDDCWQDVGTYTNGLLNEKNTPRRLHADQAFFEFMPIDDGTPSGTIDTPESALFPNVKLWRSFQFGKNLQLIVTDYRSKRPDHLIPEDGFPGTVILDKATIQAVAPAGTYDSLSQDLFAVVNIDDPTYATQRSFLLAALGEAYTAAGLSAADASAKAVAVVKGSLALVVVNTILTEAGFTSGQLIPTAGQDKGIAYAQIGKQNLFDNIGSRYLVVKPLFDLYSGYKYATTAKASEDVYGADQEAFLRAQLQQSTATYKVWISSTSLTSMPLDLRTQTALPALLQQQLYFDVDQWDGLPDKRAEIIKFIGDNGIKNVIAVCGDIHAGFVSKATAATGNDVAVITSPAISSQTLKEELIDAATSLGLGQAAVDLVSNGLEQILLASNTDMLAAKTDQHGFATIEVTSASAKATLHQISYTEITKDYSKDLATLATKFTTTVFNIAGGAITPG